MKNKFRCVNEHEVCAGVLGGLAYSLEVPAWILRVLMVLLCIGTTGGFFLIYFLVGCLAPEWDTDPEDYEEICE